MNRPTAALAALGVLLIAAAPAFAYFEITDVGAREIALGPSSMVLATDASAYRWNPAGLASLRGPEILVDYASPYGLESVTEGTIAGATRWLGTGWALAWHHVGIADVYGEDQFCAAAGRTLARPRAGHEIQGGATFKFQRVAFQPFTVPGGGTVDYGVVSRGSLDASLRWVTPWKVELAWAGRDLLEPHYEFIAGSGGQRITWHQDVAAAVHWHPESTVLLGWSRLDERTTTLTGGLEIEFFKVFTIRSSLSNLSRIYQAQRSPNELAFGGGFGVHHRDWFVDASAQTNRDLGATYRVTLRVPLQGRRTP